MIVAVFGPWGSGKTSFANLLSAELRSLGGSCTWFNPWQFTNSEAMTLAFFDLLATSISPTKELDRRAIREAFYHYGEGVTSLSLTSGLTRKARNGILTTVRDMAPYEVPSLGEQRDHLVRLFAANPKPVIVFIDDIDRLFAEDIRLLIQLVKSNSDFPNLKFVLLFQKETIEAALKTDGQTGGEFLEKIIELPIELPLIRGARYVDDLLREMADIFGDLGTFYEEDNARWQRLLQQGILQPFTTLRQKNRLLDRLQLHKWSMETGLGIDLNMVDLLALEILRALDYPLYTVLRRYGPMFTDSEPDEKEGQRQLADLLAEAGDGDHKLGRIILEELFPCFNPTGISGRRDDDELAFRICRSRHLPKYFFEGLLAEEMSRASRARLKHVAERGEGLHDILSLFDEHKLLNEGLDHLRSIAQCIPKRAWKQAALDLARICDACGKGTHRSLDRSVVRAAASTLEAILERATPRERASIVAATASGGIQLPCLLLKTDSSESLSERARHRCELLLCRGIAAAADEGRLEHMELYGPMLTLWRCKSPKAASAFVRSVAGEPRRFMEFARAVVPTQRVRTGIDLTPRPRYEGVVVAILDFLPRRTALQSAKAALKTITSKRDVEFLDVLVSELSRLEPKAVVLTVETTATDASNFAESQALSGRS